MRQIGFFQLRQPVMVVAGGKYISMVSSSALRFLRRLDRGETPVGEQLGFSITTLQNSSQSAGLATARFTYSPSPAK